MMLFSSKKKKKAASPAARLQKMLNAQKKKMKRKFLLTELKAALTLILPAVLAFLASAAVKTFLRMKLREAASNVPAGGSESPAPEAETPVPVSLETSRPEFVTPEPADTSPAG